MTWLGSLIAETPHPLEDPHAAAVRLVLRSGQVIDGTPEKQAACFEALLAFAQAHETAFVICFVGRDYDALWEEINGTAPRHSSCAVAAA